MNLKSIIVLLVVTCISQVSTAQVNTNSPYSRFGIGNLTPTFSGQSFAMGGITAALDDSTRLNFGNAASYGSLGGATAEFAFQGEFTQLKNSTLSSTSFNAHFGGFSVGFPIAKGLGMGLGLKPYSQSGYQVATPDVSVSQDTIKFKGTGGLSDAFFGIGYEFKNFSIGANYSYLFGKMNKERRLIYADSVSYDFLVNDEIRMNDFVYDLGFQFRSPEMGKWHFILGATYMPQQSLKTFANSHAYTYTETAFGDAVKDTVLDTGGDVEQVATNLASSFKVGLTFYKGNSFLIGAEYNYEDWSTFNLLGQSGSLLPSKQYRIGGQYIPKTDINDRIMKGNKLTQKLTYRFGVRYNQTYLNLDGTQLNEFGINVGIDFPVYTKGWTTKASYINLGLELGKRGTTENNLIQENFARFNLSYTFNDDWFKTRKID